jgi:sec-independent protein translocase protein TatB
MFGMGMSEILVILLVAALFLGPEKLPEAATKISKGIRDLRRQTRDLQSTIENDTEIGGAIRDLKSALRGEDFRRPPVRRPLSGEGESAVAGAIAAAESTYLPSPPVEHELASDPATGEAPLAAPEAQVAAPAAAADAPADAPKVTLATTVGASDLEPGATGGSDDAAELARLVRPAVGAIKRDDHGHT